jgi:hypothetical protein
MKLTTKILKKLIKEELNTLRETTVDYKSVVAQLIKDYEGGQGELDDAVYYQFFRSLPQMSVEPNVTGGQRINSVKALHAAQVLKALKKMGLPAASKFEVESGRELVFRGDEMELKKAANKLGLALAFKLDPVRGQTTKTGALHHDDFK